MLQFQYLPGCIVHYKQWKTIEPHLFVNQNINRCMESTRMNTRSLTWMNSCITEVGRRWADKLSVIIIIITTLRFMFLVFFSPGGPLRSAVVICYSWPTNLFFTEVCVISSRSRDKVNPDTTSICQCTDLLLWGKHRQLIRQRFSWDNWPSLPNFFLFFFT